ncbi:DNA polymerase I [Emticicia oligotrophica DSM 17448]|uniref:DNA polymerase I n=1 Tax=Emticicia oligotrophica (strain DSM 17448 / CIP 109782 / MTCC 6937 / GPTSA100-15) TaxID=929562 RepID=A0ABN4ASU7_EMTOG|nr:DNA polymerase I [Emticicia oligotrophica]AFK05225.1 DNA polymerase I [Emticicia oligotrophica DSM 17448]
MPTKKLFLLDAMALIYRAHFAFMKAPRLTSTGLNTSCVFGVANAILEVIQKEKPTHIGVAFDLPGGTFRNDWFPEYKANRQEQPEDITIAIPYVKKLVEAMDIPLLMLAGYEADDVIGTLAKQAAKHDFEVFMMTPDKDYGQLVEDHIYIYKPAIGGKDAEKLGVKEVCEKWGIEHPEQVVDILGLMGDAVDNIPGVPGVGEKTAAKLIATYGSIENMYENADKLTGKVGEAIKNNKEQALLSKKLAQIELNVPVEFNEDFLKITHPKPELMGPLLDELEFRTLRKRLLPNEPVPASSSGDSSQKSNPSTAPVNALKAKSGTQISMFEAMGAPAAPQIAAQTPFEEEEELQYRANSVKDTILSKVHEYHLMDTPILRKSLIQYLSNQEEFCFDSETTSVDAVDAEVVGLSFAYYAGEAFYVPIPSEKEEAQAVMNEFKEVFENESIIKIGQNIKYDLMVLKNYGIELKGTLFDTMLAHYIIEPEQRHGMDYLANIYLNYEPVSIETLIGKGKSQGSMRDVALEKIKDYAAEDADITFQLKHILAPKLADSQQQKLLQQVEMPLVKVLADMEMEGVRVDESALQEMSSVLESDVRQIQSDIFNIAGQEFNVASPKQLGEILFEKLKLDKNAKKTKTGQYATGEDILSKLENEHEIVRKILDFRELVKLKNTYVDALPALISKKTGRIHTSYNQAVAATGRLSSTNPNLQNIPIRTPRGREIRKAFVPRNDEYVILSADYSQIELRIMAAFSGDESMLEAFNQGIDIHSTTASKVFRVGLSDVTSDMRRKAKMVNFGIIYGISAFGLSQRLNIPRGEAKEIIDAYWVEFPKIKQFMDDTINKAREVKYAETILGRRRYLRDINSQNMTDRGFAERNAINAPIQGSAADMIKVAMINIHDFMKKEQLQSRMILQVHDELVFDAHRSEVDFLKTKVDELMCTAIPLTVKMETGMGIGQNWLEAH